MANYFRKALLLFFFFSSALAFSGSFPITSGRIVYHNYSNYEAADSELYILDLTSGAVSHISKDWNIDHAMNAHFSPDGSMIVFMGFPKDEHSFYAWDIFLWDFIADQPQNLTEGNWKRDEDPKFSPDGQTIVFKQNGDIKIMDLQGNILKSVTNDEDNPEESMPYFSTDGKKIHYSQGAGANSEIYLIDIDKNEKTPLANESGVQEYYSITMNENTYLYARWLSADDHHDQIYIGYFDGSASEKALFNSDDADYSDPYPVYDDYVLFCKNYTGNYDLYLGNLATGEVWEMDEFDVNTPIHELAPCYTPFNDPPLGTESKILQKEKNGFYSIVHEDNLIFRWKEADRENFPVTFEICDLNGHSVCLKPMQYQDDCSLVVSISSLPQGIYALRVLSKDNILIYGEKTINKR